MVVAAIAAWIFQAFEENEKLKKIPPSKFI